MAKRPGEKAKRDTLDGVSSVRAIDRAIEILKAFTPDRPTMSVIELQQRVRLSRPTLYRLLHTLALKGLIHVEGEPQRFKLGHGVMQLAHVWLKGLDVVGIARPILETLHEKTGETAALFFLQEERGICVLEFPSRHALAMSRGVGHAVKITQGATGKVILAALEPERQRGLLERVSRSERVSLDQALLAAKRNGYASSRGEIIKGSVAAAAPYFDHSGQVNGSVGLYGPDARVSDAKLAEFSRLVVAAAKQISHLLGASRGSIPPERRTLKTKASRGAKSRVR